MKKILYIDMDNVLVDFVSGIEQTDSVILQQYEGYLDDVPHIFSKMQLDKSTLLDKAIKIAEEVHANQKDKAGECYLGHIERVAAGCETIDEKIVAYLHDTIEDTHITVEYLIEQSFPRYIVDAILSVTKQDGEEYQDFIARAKQNPIGRKVKISDLLDNMNLTRLKSISTKDIERSEKYRCSLVRLLQIN